MTALPYVNHVPPVWRRRQWRSGTLAELQDYWLTPFVFPQQLRPLVLILHTYPKPGWELRLWTWLRGSDFGMVRSLDDRRTYRASVDCHHCNFCPSKQQGVTSDAHATWLTYHNLVFVEVKLKLAFSFVKHYNMEAYRIVEIYFHAFLPAILEGPSGHLHEAADLPTVSTEYANRANPKRVWTL